MEDELPRKLGLKEGQRVYLVSAPAEFAGELARVSGLSHLRTSLGSEAADVIIAWPESNLVEMFQELLHALKPDGAVWIVIPKKATGRAGPSFQSLLDAALPLGLVDNKSLTFSDHEYGIRFMIRRRLRKTLKTAQ